MTDARRGYTGYHDAAGRHHLVDNAVPGQSLVWVTPPLNREGFDELLWRFLEDALEYVSEHLTENIESNYTEEYLAAEGYTFRLSAKLIPSVHYAAIFDINAEGTT